MSKRNAENTSYDPHTLGDADSITRRSALNKIASGGAVGALLISTFPSGTEASPTPPMKIDTMTAQHWKQLMGKRFRAKDLYVSDDGHRSTTELRLEQVMANDWRIKDRHRPSHLRPFAISLLFSSKDEIPNSTYAIENDALGRSLLFLHEVPLADHPDKNIYEIILN